MSYVPLTEEEVAMMRTAAILMEAYLNESLTDPCLDSPDARKRQETALLKLAKDLHNRRFHDPDDWKSLELIEKESARSWLAEYVVQLKDNNEHPSVLKRFEEALEVLRVQIKNQEEYDRSFLGKE